MNGCDCGRYVDGKPVGCVKHGVKFVRFVCICEHGYVRCMTTVLKRGSLCDNCKAYANGDQYHHNNGYHGPKVAGDRVNYGTAY